MSEEMWQVIANIVAPGGALASLVAIIIFILNNKKDKEKEKNEKEAAAKEEAKERKRRQEEVDAENRKRDEENRRLIADLKQTMENEISKINTKIDLNEAHRQTELTEINGRLKEHNGYAKTFTEVKETVNKLSDKVATMAEDLSFVKARIEN